LKNGDLNDQPQDVVKLHEEIDTLKFTLAKFVSGIESLNKLLRYCKCSTGKFGNGYEGEIYVRDENIVVCYFCGKVGHMTSKCRDRPRNGHLMHLKLTKKDHKRFGYLRKR